MPDLTDNEEKASKVGLRSEKATSVNELTIDGGLNSVHVENAKSAEQQQDIEDNDTGELNASESTKKSDIGQNEQAEYSDLIAAEGAGTSEDITRNVNQSSRKHECFAKTEKTSIEPEATAQNTVSNAFNKIISDGQGEEAWKKESSKITTSDQVVLEEIKDPKMTLSKDNESHSKVGSRRGAPKGTPRKRRNKLEIDMNFEVPESKKRGKRIQSDDELEPKIKKRTYSGHCTKDEDEDDKQYDMASNKVDDSEDHESIIQLSDLVEQIIKLQDVSDEYMNENFPDIKIRTLVNKWNTKDYTQPISQQDVNYIKGVILSKITKHSIVSITTPIPFISKVKGFYDSTQNTNQSPNSLLAKYNELYTFLEHGILNGDSSSCLLVGNKKSGKKFALNNALNSLDKKYNRGKNKAFMKIHLSGILQTDDKMAVREIARQLDINLQNFGNYSKRFGEFYDDKTRLRKEAVDDDDDDDDDNDDDDGNDYGSNADRGGDELKYGNEYVDESEEIVIDGEEEKKQFEKRSINETFSSILASLQQINFSEEESEHKTVALVFIIDEFERFTVHNRQTLLYNLFDLSTSNHTIPISVIGLTSKVNIKEQLEKRVSSRFSQRILHFFGHVGVSSSANYLFNYHVNSEVEYFWLDVRYNLCLNVDEIQNSKLKNKKYALVWNDVVNSLFYDANYGKHFKELLLKNFVTIKNQKEFLNACIFAVTKMNQENPFPKDEHFIKYNSVNNFNNFSARNDILDNLLNKSLSDLQLFLVICSARVIYTLDINFINFNLCYEEYQKLSKTLRDQRRTEFMMSSKKTLVPIEPTDSNGTSSSSSSTIVGFRIWSKAVCRGIWEKLEELGLIISPSNNMSNRANFNAPSVSRSAISSGSNVDNYDTKFFQLEVDMNDLFALVSKSHPLRKFTRI